MKQKWIRPQTTIEKFVPDEYIAVCWGVACTRWKDDPVEKEGISHAADHCGNAKNQVIYDYNKDGFADAMIEEGTDGLGNLRCTITNKNLRDVKVDDYIEWTTTAYNPLRIWHHRGTVEATFPGRPNHS